MPGARIDQPRVPASHEPLLGAPYTDGEREEHSNENDDEDDDNMGRNDTKVHNFITNVRDRTSDVSGEPSGSFAALSPTISAEDGPILQRLHSTADETHYKVYRRRWFGLVQLTLLNIIVSWDWLTYAPVSTTSAEFFNTSISAVNWLATSFLFAFVAGTPFTIYALNRGGPKLAIVIASGLIFVGNWVRYGGARSSSLSGHGKFGVTMLGQILIGFGQPFVLSAPTRYSDMWFSSEGRIAATAVASLANPFGGALGQLIDPLWATEPGQIPDMVLYVAIISSVAAIPSLFIPRAPPTPPNATAATLDNTSGHVTLRTITRLIRNPSFLVLLAPFTIFVSAFNAFSSVLNTILAPYGYSETAAGITGGLLIIVGLISAAVTSPVLDRNKRLRIPLIKLVVPVIAAMYLAFIWAPQTRGLAAPYIISSILGAASFILVPLVLELFVEVTWPITPEVSSTLCWSGGQLGGAIFIVIMDALQGSWHGDPRTDPPKNLKAGLVFLAVASWLVVPFPMVLGYWGLGRHRRDEAAAATSAGDRGRVQEDLGF